MSRATFLFFILISYSCAYNEYPLINLDITNIQETYNSKSSCEAAWIYSGMVASLLICALWLPSHRNEANKVRRNRKRRGKKSASPSHGSIGNRRFPVSISVFILQLNFLFGILKCHFIFLDRLLWQLPSLVFPLVYTIREGEDVLFCDWFANLPIKTYMKYELAICWIRH